MDASNHGRTTGLRTAHAALVSLLVAALSLAPTARAATPTLAFIATIPAADGTFTALSCPTTTSCYAAGMVSTTAGAVAATVDGGKTWKALTLPASTGPLDTISCATATSCIAGVTPPGGGGGRRSSSNKRGGQTATGTPIVIATTDGGAVWNVQTPPASVAGVISLSCPTATMCVGNTTDASLNRNGIWTANGGATWWLRPPSAVGQAAVSGNPLSCGTSSACYTGHQGTTPGPALGSVWHDLTGYSTGFPFGFKGASCPGSSTCYLSASGSGGLNDGENVVDVVTQGGASVVQSGLPSISQSQPSAFPIACASETTCEVFIGLKSGTKAQYTADSATTWATQTIPSQDKSIAAVSCPSLGTCVAVGPASSSGTAVIGYTGTAAPAVGGVVQRAGPAAGGQTVTVFGSGFATGVTVDFGAKLATGVKVLSASELTAVAPAGTPGTVTVTVHGAGGASAAGADSSYTYLSGAPSVTAVSPSSAAAYGNAQITVSGSGVGFATGVKFGSTSAKWWVPTSSNSLVAVTPAGTGAVDVHITNPAGTSATVAADHVSYVSSATGSFPVSQTLAPPPAPTSVSCGSSTVCFAAGTGGILKSVDLGSSWTVASSLQPAAISCSSATTCLATVSGGVASTVDGAHWVRHPYPAGVTGTGVVACLPAGLCFVAVGSQSLSTTDGGSTWTAHSLPAALSQPSSLACPTTKTCVLTASGELGSTSDAGAVWHATPDPSGSAGLDLVSCGTATTCMAVGYVGNITFGPTDYAASTTNGGASWTALPQNSLFVTGGISCTSATACLVSGNYDFGFTSAPPTSGEVEATTDGGQTWSVANVPTELYGQGFGNGFGSGMLYGLSCFAANSCVTVGVAASLDAQPGTVLTSVDGGNTWIAGSLPVGGVRNLTAVSCRTGGGCEAAGDGSYSPAMLGASSATAPFAAQGSPPYALTLGAASCPTATHCIAVGQAGGTLSWDGQGGAIVSGDGGVLWKPTRISLQPETLSAVSCASASDCAAVGFALWNGNGTPLVAVAVYSTDGGQTWKAASLPSDTYSLAAVSCPASTATPTCFASGSSNLGSSPTVLRSTNGGASWQELTLPSDGTQNYTGISCASATACIAVGGGAIIATTDGTTFLPQKVPSTAVAPSAVTCPTTTACVAVGADGFGQHLSAAIYTTNGGTNWLAGVTPTPISLGSVSCSSASDCIASGSVLLRSTNGGKGWATITLPSTVAKSTGGVSCVPAGTLCLATGAAASNASGVPAAILRSTSSGSTWSAQIFPMAPAPAGIDAIACPATTTCIAAGASQTIAGLGVATLPTAYASGDGGATWSDTWLLQLAGTVHTISCASANACLATDGFNVWRTTNGGSSWTIVTPPAGSNQTNLFYDLACATTTACLIVGHVQTGQAPADTVTQDEWTSSNEGSTWNEVQLPGSLSLQRLACPTAAQCFATGADATAVWEGAVAAYTTNGGGSWIETALPANLNMIFSGSGLTCPSTSVCAGTAQFGTGTRPVIGETTDGGFAWAVSPVPGSLTSLGGLACSSTTACVAVGDGATPGGIVLHGNPTAAASPRRSAAAGSVARIAHGALPARVKFRGPALAQIYRARHHGAGALDADARHLPWKGEVSRSPLPSG